MGRNDTGALAHHMLPKIAGMPWHQKMCSLELQ